MTHTTNRSKTALVLAGGGLTGAVYEIGALRAINDLLLDRTVNDFDIFIGTSAGAIVASSLANGITPETMMQANAGRHPHIPPIERKDIFNLSRTEFLRRGLKLPRTFALAWSKFLRGADDMSLFDVFWSMLEALPSGVYDGMALERYIRKVLSGPGLSNRFEALDKELYIIATELDSGERAVFGPGYSQGVPISLAVAASSAVPMVYKPVCINGREYVDGGLRGTASLDLAIEHGAELVLCINPLVPFDSRSRRARFRLSDKGMQAVANQATRISMHSGLHYHIKQLRRSHPGVDIILIEPRPDDYQMFFHNVLRYSARLLIAHHGFESVTVDLTAEYQRYKTILERHGIHISRRRVIKELTAIQASGENPQIIQDVLEARPLPDDLPLPPVAQLQRTLNELERTIESLA